MKENIYITDTIAAISTAVGGGIAIVRLSGPKSIEIAGRLFNAAGKCFFESHRVYYGHILHEGLLIDECLLTVMRAPRSYTMEDVVEISCHGGVKSVERILNAALEEGARLAEPGEFTKRAFLNGRIDLVNVQAVMDTINAQTDMAHNQAVFRLSGKLSRDIRDIRETLLNMLAEIEVSIDYPEHDMEEENKADILPKLLEIQDRIEKLMKTGKAGMVISHGVQTVIIGKPNVGKSSLLNRILMAERAIVTDIPGTTRDALQEVANVKGIPLKIVDTAGIRHTDDVVEKFGVDKSMEYAESADLILFVLDGSSEVTDEDRAIFGRIRHKRYVIVLNKCDLGRKAVLDSFGDNLDNIVEISAKANMNMEMLYEHIYNIFVDKEISVENTALISNTRDMESLKAALVHIKEAISAIYLGMPEDVLAIDMNAAYGHLGQIIGESAGEDVIDRIFSQFCLGK